MDTIELEAIAAVLDMDGKAIQCTIKLCGPKLSAAEIAKYQANYADGKVASAALRQPGITNEQALEALTVLCRGIRGRG